MHGLYCGHWEVEYFLKPHRFRLWKKLKKLTWNWFDEGKFMATVILINF